MLLLAWSISYLHFLTPSFQLLERVPSCIGIVYGFCQAVGLCLHQTTNHPFHTTFHSLCEVIWKSEPLSEAAASPSQLGVTCKLNLHILFSITLALKEVPNNQTRPLQNLIRHTVLLHEWTISNSGLPTGFWDYINSTLDWPRHFGCLKCPFLYKRPSIQPDYIFCDIILAIPWPKRERETQESNI